MNIISFSLFWKPLSTGKNHFSITECTAKKSVQLPTDYYRDFIMKRDVLSYLKNRWYAY